MGVGMLDEFLRWAADRGVGADQLDAYRVCAEQILAQAGGTPVEAKHVEAARAVLRGRGVKAPVVAQVRSVGDALQHFQRDASGARLSSPQIASAALAQARARSVRPSQAGAGTEDRRVIRLSTASVLAGYLGLLVAVVGGYLVFRAVSSSEKSVAKVQRSAAAQSEVDVAPSPEEAAVQSVYATFHKAMRAGDLAQLKQVMAKEKLAELGGDGGAPQLQLAKQLYPEKATVVSVVVTENIAVLTAKAKIEGQTAKGVIDFVKEAGAWKVKNADWSVTFSAEPDEPQRRPASKVVRPAELPQLQGTWQGGEVGGGASWTLTFSQGHRLQARSSSGESYAGDVVIRWDLGVEGNSIRVPPGWGPLDVEIDEASNSDAVGKVALAAFTRHDTELKLCGGAPGYPKRVTSFESPGPGFHCMVLTKTGEGELSDPQQDPEASEPAAEDIGPGEATLLLDGVAQRYPLKVGFFSETKMKDPSRAMLHFENPGEAHSNARRVLLILDATKVGRHVADGQAIHDAMFNDRPVAVGEPVGGARAAMFRWQADGGQMFPPKIGTRCEINVVSPYTGQSRSQFVAEVPDCLVHSAGIDRRIRDLKISVRGPIDG